MTGHSSSIIRPARGSNFQPVFNGVPLQLSARGVKFDGRLGLERMDIVARFLDTLQGMVEQEPAFIFRMIGTGI